MSEATQALRRQQAAEADARTAPPTPATCAACEEHPAVPGGTLCTECIRIFEDDQA